MDSHWIGSPNFTRGRRGYKPQAVVIHIMEGTLAGTDAWFLDAASRVSAHYGIGRDGTVHQYVDEADTAWHAGRRSSDASWKLLDRARPGSLAGINPNYVTLGIEHEGEAADPWSDSLLAASVELTRLLCDRWHIPLDRDHIIGHREIYARKSCPGSWVDLDRLVARVREQAADPASYNFVARAGVVEVRKALHIRRQRPATDAPSLRVAKPGSRLAFEGWTSNGQAVAGNPHWYRDDRGDYFWAGATASPIPGLG